MVTRAILVLAGLVLAGCSGSANEVTATNEVTAHDRTGQPATRVLVTGFHDWHELGDPPNIWRCRDNPSCRLLIGDLGLDASAPPASYTGPLIDRLERAAPEIEWTFRTLPVTWGVFNQVPTEYDVIINIGLGVYDRTDALQLERGAYNLQAGVDALQQGSDSTIDPNQGTVLEAPGPIAERIDALVGTRIAGYEILGASARSDNSYLCNQTHWFALAAVLGGEGPREAYFLHIPYAANDDYGPLADAVAGVVLGLARAPGATGSENKG